jgi:hypothetical protein
MIAAVLLAHDAAIVANLAAGGQPQPLEHSLDQLTSTRPNRDVPGQTVDAKKSASCCLFEL